MNYNSNRRFELLAIFGRGDRIAKPLSLTYPYQTPHRFSGREEMIKRYSSDDLESCLSLFVRVFNGEPWHDQWTHDSARIYLRELIEHRRFMGFTSWDGEILVGVALGHLKSHYRGDELFIDELYIHPDCQRQGHGKALMDVVEQSARELSLVSITLLTGKEKPSFSFFKKCGCRHLPYLAFMHKRLV